MPRPALYGGGKTYRFQGFLTTIGAREFEKARQELAKLSGVESPSQADTVEYLARGRKWKQSDTTEVQFADK